MSKLKKFVAGALAAVVCATSFSAPTPATADAATYCCHNIYQMESPKYYTTHTVGECGTYTMWGYKGPETMICKLKYDVYSVKYGCYKCNYTYTGYRSGNVYHSSNGRCK